MTKPNKSLWVYLILFFDTVIGLKYKGKQKSSYIFTSVRFSLCFPQVSHQLIKKMSCAMRHKLSVSQWPAEKSKIPKVFILLGAYTEWYLYKLSEFKNAQYGFYTLVKLSYLWVVSSI
jgi:hypothetical protein